MKLGVLFSGGKDSTLAAWIAKKERYKLSCLITLESENKESFMFHTPSIVKTKVQADSLGIPLIIQKTKGDKEIELNDLKIALQKAKESYGIEGVITGAVESVYQASRIQKICNELELEVFNPLWQKPQEELVLELIKEKFEVIIVGVFAYPLTKDWIGKKLDRCLLGSLRLIKEKWGISVAGEGGEYESFVVNCPLFKNPLKVKDIQTSGEGNSWRGEIVL